MTEPTTCHRCGALLGDVDTHLEWHEQTRTDTADPSTLPGILYDVRPDGRAIPVCGVCRHPADRLEPLLGTHPALVRVRPCGHDVVNERRRG